VYFPVSFCPSLVNLASVDLSTVSHKAFTQLTLTCASPGLRFVDGRTRIDVTCQEDGTWSDLVSDCAG
jgi:hypothetical protein